MKTGLWIAILCTLVAATALAQPCSAPIVGVVPQDATTDDAIEVQLQNFQNWGSTKDIVYSGGSVSINGSILLIQAYTIPGIPPPPGFFPGCATLITSLGNLPAGTYDVQWLASAAPAASEVAASRPVHADQGGSFGFPIASATLTVAQAVVVPSVPAQPIPSVSVAGLFLLACLLATAGALLLRG